MRRRPKAVKAQALNLLGSSYQPQRAAANQACAQQGVRLCGRISLGQGKTEPGLCHGEFCVTAIR